MSQNRLFFNVLSGLMVTCAHLSASLLLTDENSTPPTSPTETLAPPQKPAPVAMPWLTGPLITPSAHVVPVGHMNVEPYFNVNVGTGSYDMHWKGHNAKHNFYNLQGQVPIQFGIFNRWDFQFTPQFSWNHISGASHWVLNDLPFIFDYQVVNDKFGEWWPAIKLAFRATIPWGKYQKLDPDDKGTDIGGGGTWNPGVVLVLSRLFHYTGVHFLSTRLAIGYTVPNSVHVKGFNAYGGGHHTHGTVYPGPIFNVFLGLEYTLTQKWALALDAVYFHNNHTRFSGHKGTTDGMPNSVGGPSSESISLAPAIEYNWSAYCGVIAGVWFSVAGRNSAEFINGVIAINVYK
ncbi:MAG TPA: hypothetical protein VGJ00_09150 [Rhabdochlamydiaceae bacterium]